MVKSRGGLAVMLLRQGVMVVMVIMRIVRGMPKVGIIILGDVAAGLSRILLIILFDGGFGFAGMYSRIWQWEVLPFQSSTTFSLRARTTNQQYTDPTKPLFPQPQYDTSQYLLKNQQDSTSPEHQIIYFSQAREIIYDYSTGCINIFQKQLKYFQDLFLTLIHELISVCNLSLIVCFIYGLGLVGGIRRNGGGLVGGMMRCLVLGFAAVGRLGLSWILLFALFAAAEPLILQITVQKQHIRPSNMQTQQFCTLHPHSQL